MIGHFGHAEVRILKPGEDSGQPAERTTSTYEAPECRSLDALVGRAADVWSLACILSEVFTFMVLGKKGLEEFIDRRKAPDDKRDAFHDGESIKSSVTEWLESLEKYVPEYRRTLISALVELLKHMFQQGPTDRPDMSTVRDNYNKIQEEWSQSLTPARKSELVEKLDRVAAVEDCAEGGEAKIPATAPPLRTSQDNIAHIERPIDPDPWFKSSKRIVRNRFSPTIGPAQTQQFPSELPAEPVEAEQRHGRLTALHRAAWSGQEATARMLLIEGKAEIEAKDNAGRTALHVAAWQGHEATARMLLVEAKAEIQAKDDDGQTALHLAFRRGHEATAWMLLIQGKAETKAKYNGQTALHRAVHNGQEATARMLLVEGKADIEDKDDVRRTALHMAA